jgi:hypothetical protein
MRARSAICALAVVAVAAPAEAAAQAPTPEDWAAQANEHCAQVSPKNRKLIDRSFERIDDERFRRAGKLWNRAWRRSLEAFARIERLPRPAADTRRIQRWIDGERRSLRVAIRAGNALADARVNRWDRLVDRSARIDRKAQRLVRDLPMPRCLSID